MKEEINESTGEKYSGKQPVSFCKLNGTGFG
jgi:hypothetical protein